MEIKYKLQGDGRDSWEITENGTKYMVYEDPNAKIPISNVNIETLTDEQILQLKNKLGL